MFLQRALPDVFPCAVVKEFNTPSGEVRGTDSKRILQVLGMSDAEVPPEAPKLGKSAAVSGLKAPTKPTCTQLIFRDPFSWFHVRPTHRIVSQTL